MHASEQVWFISGAGHSGSTLLGLMLGAHPRVFYAGEARKSEFLGDPSKPLKKRVCKLCGEGCPIWGGLRLSEGDDVYECLARRTGKPIVLDSTKSIEWLTKQIDRLGRCGTKMSMIALGRDGRAIVNSRLRKYPTSSPRTETERWIEQITATESLAAQFPGTVLRVRYEALASAPEPTMQTLCQALGIDLVPNMLAPWSTDQHPLGGNNGTQFLLARQRARDHQTRDRDSLLNQDGARAYYGEHPPAIVLDLRWKHELGEDALREFDALAGETNRPYAWDEGDPT